MKLEKDIYTVKEVAKMLSLESPAIRAAIKAGRLKAESFGKSYIIHRDDLAEYLAYRERRENGGK